MSNSIKYRQSVTSEPYESALTPEGLTLDEYKLLTEEHTATEEKYEEAIGVHDEWKATKLDEEQKAAEEKKKKKERQAAILREKQEAKNKQKKLDELKKVKKAVNAMAEKKKKDDLKKEEKRL
ncbi:hypothetical protein EV421DRAFT_1912500 [Armillaria borealis]|uniref:Uncharacterized protein n=1 Tax=Armillaria borealis TaxID=47425 RepID=A0AA39IUQ2_9AGAR|nr:hypothetical protein EV421DRAFT_1912500 [Armillaria borealis]